MNSILLTCFFGVPGTNWPLIPLHISNPFLFVSPYQTVQHFNLQVAAEDAAPPNALWSVTLSIGMTAGFGRWTFLIDLIDGPLLLYK